MKWVIFISLVCLVSFAELKSLPRRYRHAEDHPWTISIGSQVSGKDFDVIVLFLVSQAVPHATLEEVKNISSDIVLLYHKCDDNEQSNTECTKPLGTVFLNKLCHDEEFSNKYGFHDCCAKTDPERNECLLAHKMSLAAPDSDYGEEKVCEAYQEDQDNAGIQYIHEVGRNNAGVLIVLLLEAYKSFEKILETCCGTADKDACIEEEATKVKDKFNELIDEQENTCFNLEKYGKDTLYALKFIETHEKFINANQETISHIAKSVVHIYEELCKGDTLEALLDRASLSQYVCEHKNDISANLDSCCEKPLVERPTCLSTLENDARSPDLPPPTEEIIKETEACKLYAEHGDKHKESFIFTLTINHPELSKLLKMEILHKYKGLLEKCCQLEDHVQCLHIGEDELKLDIAKITEVVKYNCENYKEMGAYFFQNYYLIKYSKIIPQAPTSNLIQFSKKVAKVTEKCCDLDSDHRISCAVEDTDKLIGSLCRYHKEKFINKQLCNCCDSSFITRWECIHNLELDPLYVPPPFKPAALDDPEKLCSPDEETVQESKQGLLSDLTKSKPNMSDEMLAAAIEAFRKLQADCCAAENKKECFDTKGQKLVDDIQNDHIIQ